MTHFWPFFSAARVLPLCFMTDPNYPEKPPFDYVTSGFFYRIFNLTKMIMIRITKCNRGFHGLDEKPAKRAFSLYSLRYR